MRAPDRARFRDPRRFVVEQALDARHRRRLADEIGEAHLEAARDRPEAVEHRVVQRAEPVEIERGAVPLQHFDEARHVRALHVVRQAHGHRELGDRVLHVAVARRQRDRIAQSLDADLLDRQLAQVGQRLGVGENEAFGCVHD
jgi:hypothetical protein